MSGRVLQLQETRSRRRGDRLAGFALGFLSGFGMAALLCGAAAVAVIVAVHP